MQQVAHPQNRGIPRVKATLVDKSVENNWRAQGHQDRAIDVKK